MKELSTSNKTDTVSEGTDSDEDDKCSRSGSNKMKRQSVDFKRGSYARIPDKTRAKLIKLVVEQGVGVVHASRKLGIKYTTGKHIVRRYKRTGSFIDKRFKNVDGQLPEQSQNEFPVVPAKPNVPAANKLTNVDEWLKKLPFALQPQHTKIAGTNIAT